MYLPTIKRSTLILHLSFGFSNIDYLKSFDIHIQVAQEQKYYTRVGLHNNKVCSESYPPLTGGMMETWSPEASAVLNARSPMSRYWRLSATAHTGKNGPILGKDLTKLLSRLSSVATGLLSQKIRIKVLDKRTRTTYKLQHTPITQKSYA